MQNKVDLALAKEMDPIEKLVTADNALTAEIVQLDETIAHEKVEPGGSTNKQRRRQLKHFHHVITTDFLPRKQKYVQYNAQFGDRNSFSKTDIDATFMRMKEDAMQNGQLKPGYNLQIGTQNQFVLYYDINQRPTDQRTLIPFLEQINLVDHPFQYTVADAGYGSERNYRWIEENSGAIALIPYTMYDKEQSRSYQKDPHKRMNWDYDEEADVYTDDRGIKFAFQKEYDKTEKDGTVKHFRRYESLNYQDPEGYYWATTRNGYQRRIDINPTWEHYKTDMREKLSSEEGQRLYGLRKIEDEPVFGNLKAHLKFLRLSVRGIAKVRNEVGIALLAYNIMKWQRAISLYSFLSAMISEYIQKMGIQPLLIVSNKCKPKKIWPSTDIRSIIMCQWTSHQPIHVTVSYARFLATPAH